MTPAEHAATEFHEMGSAVFLAEYADKLDHTGYPVHASEIRKALALVELAIELEQRWVETRTRATELERERDEWRDRAGKGHATTLDMLTAERQRAERAETALAEAVDVAIWMSGSSDFSPGGIAHEGWLKMRPQLHHAMEALPDRAVLGERA